MKKPLIAIFGTLENDYCMLRTRYSRAVTAHGGVPFLVMMYQPDDNLQQIIDTADGFLFAGGIDLAPELYGEKPLNDTVKVDPERDRTELAALPLILKTSKPVLSICRGIQSNNVALGGTLYQDIPTEVASEVAHREGGRDTRHEMDIFEGTPLYDIIGRSRININSYHHQAVKKIAPGFEIAAFSEDGLVEAIYRKDKKFVLGVQWHPEFLFQKYPEHKTIFQAFVDACK